MKIMEVLNEPKAALAYMERLVNNGSPSGFTFVNTTSPETNPIFTSSFKLCAIYDDISRFSAFGAAFPFSVMSRNGLDFVFVHPDWTVFKRQIAIEPIDLIVEPTSSSRTVKVDDCNCYIKLCYPKVLGRITRELQEVHIKSGIDVTNILGELVKDPNTPDGLGFLAERGGKVYHHEDGDIGYIIRDAYPTGKNADKIRAMIPAFSLFSADRNNDDLPLIIQVLNHRREGMDYIFEQLIFPVIDCYFTCVFRGGIQPEMHSQNFLLGIDSALNIVSVVMRDLDSMDKDVSIMEQFGFSNLLMSYPYKCISNHQYNYKIKHSFMYDHKLGEYFFDQLSNCLVSYGVVGANMMSIEIRRYVQKKYGQLLKDFFPSDGKWYKFENVLIDRTIVERPYIAIDNPKYR